MNKSKNSSKIQIVYTQEGKPSHLQIPIERIRSFSESERETFEILMDPVWSKTLRERYAEVIKNPEKAVAESIPLDEIDD